MTETNAAAECLYRTAGFVPTGRRRPLPSNTQLEVIEMERPRRDPEGRRAVRALAERRRQARVVRRRFLPPAELRDGSVERLFWQALCHLGGLVGPVRARSLAAVVLRAMSVTDRGFVKSVFRIAGRRVWGQTPELVKLPEEWWLASPLLRVRRLGLNFELDLRDNLQRILYYTGTYEPGVIRFFRDELCRDDVFVDVGAHIGVHSLTVARHLQRRGGGRVIAFEPSHESAQRLRAAAHRNRLAVTVIEGALGVSRGTIELFADPAYDLADAGVRSQYGEGEFVQTASVTTLDAWANDVSLERLDAIKLDVDGAELAALQGMRESLRRLRPRVLVVEIKEVALERAGVEAEEVRRLLHSYGYEATGQAFFSANEAFRLASR